MGLAHSLLQAGTITREEKNSRFEESLAELAAVAQDLHLGEKSRMMAEANGVWCAATLGGILEG